MREGSAEAQVACPREAAFAWLVDPRHASEWFAGVALPEPPARPLRVGATWRFSMTRQRGRLIPMRLAEYQSPERFTWETTYPSWRGNLQWACALSPAAPGADTEDSREEPEAATLLRLTIRQRPGLLGWPALLLAGLLGQLRVTEGASMAARAERAAQRAAEALEALPTTSYGTERRAPRPRHSQRGGKGGKGRRR
jgi:uncharacterized protein YndB with AHSA1/START domain